MQIELATCFINVSPKYSKICQKLVSRWPLGMQYKHRSRGRVKRWWICLKFGVWDNLNLETNCANEQFDQKKKLIFGTPYTLLVDSWLPPPPLYSLKQTWACFAVYRLMPGYRSLNLFYTWWTLFIAPFGTVINGQLDDGRAYFDLFSKNTAKFEPSLPIATKLCTLKTATGSDGSVLLLKSE